MSVKQRYLNGEKVCGTMIRVVRTPAVVALAKKAGLDFVMFDCEHGCFGPETLHEVFMVANAMDIEAWVRVPVGTKDYISRYLDLGAKGVMVPLVETPEYAEQLVKYSKYAPVGCRGFSNGAHTLYQGGDHKQIMKDSNDSVCAIIQIETKQGVERVEEILSVPGIDAVVLGPNDLSVSFGCPGELTAPVLVEAIHKVSAACKKYNKMFSIQCGPKVFDTYKDDVSFVMQYGDTEALFDGFTKVKAYSDALHK